MHEAVEKELLAESKNLIFPFNRTISICRGTHTIVYKKSQTKYRYRGESQTKILSFTHGYRDRMCSPIN